ncbi:ATP synthase F1 subunit gamma [Candidatus Roizmanbacteria bacterium]|nr:ATP synthase F1 subunit gamma [Candidatus Roizmanbacteria bacterium]
MNLRQVRRKIKSVGNVKKITRAMQLVSAVKMKKAQTVAIEGRPYREKLSEMFHKVLPGIDVSQLPIMKVDRSQSDRELIVLITANKGMCGAFNVNLFRVLVNNSPDFSKTDVITIGKKGAAFAPVVGASAIADYTSNNQMIDVSAVFELVLKRYMEGKYTKVSLVYNKFISTLRNDPVKEQILPFALETEKEKQAPVQYVVEPDAYILMERLVLSYLEEKIRGAIQNSEASEHSARMVAMKNATDNAVDVIYNLTLTGNKIRQQKITYELLDMITAKESVEV